MSEAVTHSPNFHDTSFRFMWNMIKGPPAVVQRTTVRPRAILPNVLPPRVTTRTYVVPGRVYYVPQSVMYYSAPVYYVPRVVVYR